MKVKITKSVSELQGIGDKIEIEMEINPMHPLKLNDFISSHLKTSDYYVGHAISDSRVHTLEFTPNNWRNPRRVEIIFD